VAAVEASRIHIEALAASPTPVYGVSTGFGALATVTSAGYAKAVATQPDSFARCGSGPEVEREVIRAMMLLQLSTLASGRTGVRRETAQATPTCVGRTAPVVHEYGSLGCSGIWPRWPRRPAVMGEGQVRDAADRLISPPALHTLTLASPSRKEGLALINGTDGMLGQLVLAWPTWTTCCGWLTSRRP
jgi:histidine ammonia-lyase